MTSPRRTNRLGVPVLLALTAGPALILGAALWFLADLVPQCTTQVRSSAVSPDSATTLVTFSLDCGSGPENIQAAIHTSAEPFSPDTAQTFFSAEGTQDIAARWHADGAIEIRLPESASINRQADEVAGIAVTYR